MHLRNSRRRRSLLQSLEPRHLMAAGPYSPAAGQPGSTAIDRLSPSIIGWASRVVDYSPGSAVDAAFGNANQSLGPAQGQPDSVVSLGNGGSLTVGFDSPIRDGLGPDFSIFENSFSDTFLELAFVEVSSDGVQFVRFANDSRTASAIGPFGELEPTNLNNLAGKYRGGFGTPFDLSELATVPGLNVNAITHVRIVDIVGDGTNLDSQGDPIYDPTPTVGSAGFDVDAIGVMRSVVTGTMTVDLETLGQSLPVGGFDNDGVLGGPFVQTPLQLNNDFDPTFGSWRGFAISNVTDNRTAGFTNQYSAITGGGHDGSATYAVGFFDTSATDLSLLPTITIDPANPSSFDSMWVTNTTYAALSMRSGDQFAKRFGGPSGNDPDFLILDIVGLNGQSQSVGTVSVDLADFRFANNTLDTILEDWFRVDLTSLVGARSLRMSMRSSDVGSFGINTPTYFAIDDVTIRQPAVPLDLETLQTDESQSVTARVSRPSNEDGLPLVVNLLATGNSGINVPASVTIPAGRSFVEFELLPPNDSVAGSTRTLSITASSDGLLPTTRTLSIVDDDLPAITFVNAIANRIENSGETIYQLSRNDADISLPLTVTLRVEGSSILSVPAVAQFVAGNRTTTFTATVLDDTQFGSGQTATIVATANGRTPATATLEILENDLPTLTATLSGSLDESVPSQTATLQVRRNTVDLSTPLNVSIIVPSGAPINAPSVVTIPVGQSNLTVQLGVINDRIINGSPSYSLRVTNENFVSSTIDVMVADNDVAASISITAPASIDESGGATIVDFELAGRRLNVGQFNNNAGTTGRFAFGEVSLENSFDNSFGFENWSGFALSRGVDNQTPGFGNQYASIVGSGAGDSDTYAIAYAASPVTLARQAGSRPFESLAITNTTYAALSMQTGDQFAKKFGGPIGSDPDFFLLKIQGLDADGDSIGEIEVPLADFRFEDDSLDYILDQWSTIDVRAIGEALTLSFSLSSSDNGTFGMNTPAYFAIDDVRLQPNPVVAPEITLTRTGDLDNALSVTLSTDFPGVQVPTSITFDAGVDRITTKMTLINDSLASNRSAVTVTATSAITPTVTTLSTYQDDELPQLTATPSTDLLSESRSMTLLVHRNTIDVSGPLSINIQLNAPENVVSPATIIIPAGERSVSLAVDALEDARASGNSEANFRFSATGFATAMSRVSVVDNDVAQIDIESDDPIALAEGSAGTVRVRLTSRPDSVVVVQAQSNRSRISVSPLELTFGADNWNQYQTVTMIVPADLTLHPILEGSIRLSVVADRSDALFDDAVPIEIPATITDQLPRNAEVRAVDGQTVVTDPVAAITLATFARGSDVDLRTSDGDDMVRIVGLPVSTGLFSVRTQNGNDVVNLQTMQFTSIDGGEGIDELILALPASGSFQTVDLASMVAHRVTRFEKLTLGSDPSVTLRIDSEAFSEVFSDAPPQILVEAGAMVDLVGEWSFGNLTSINGELAHQLFSGDFSIVIMASSIHQNPRDIHDVNADGIVDALDALLIINRLNTQTDSTLPPPPEDIVWSGPFFDVSGEGGISALDALRVINYLNQRDQTIGEPILGLVADNETTSHESIVDELMGVLF